MKEGYKALGEFIRQIDIRNTEGKEDNLLGVSVQKQFIPSIANTVGTDFTKYKVVKKGQFTYIPDTSRRGDKIAIALLQDYEEGLVSNVYTVFEVIDEEKLLPEYLMLWFSRPEFDRYARFKSHGSVREIMDWDEMCKVELPVPSIEKQRSIVKAYKAITDRIELKRRINDNLQQQAAALFSSLYDRSNTEVRFTDLIQILGGGTPKTGENTYWNGNIAFFTPKDVGIPYTLITEKTISKEGLSHCNSRLYPVNTVFVTARGTVGKVGMSGVPMAMNQSCYALVGKETHQLLVYFYTLKAVDRLKHKASGAVFDAITTRDFESEQIMKLSDDDATAFLRVAEPMFQEVLNNNIENLRLSTLRDSLLPKLMSGEIDVSAVQL